jgi:hypothetical protein
MLNWDRWAAGTGIGFVLAALIGFLIVPEVPSVDEGSEFVLNFFSLNDSDMLWQSFFYGLAGVFLLWFAGTLAGTLRRAELDHAGRLPGVIVGSAAAATALFLLGVTAWGAIASGVEVMDQGVAYGLYQLGNYAFVMTDFPAAAFVLAVSLGIARTVFLPMSVAWVGGVVALLLVVNAGGRLLADESTFAAGGTTGTIIFVLFIFWVLVTSIFLVQRVPAGRRMPES